MAKYQKVASVYKKKPDNDWIGWVAATGIIFVLMAACGG